jgi:hypothetical protein
MMAQVVFRRTLPTGPSGEITPFQLLECDAQGGDGTYKNEDAALAFILGQMPFKASKAGAISTSWVRVSVSLVSSFRKPRAVVTITDHYCIHACLMLEHLPNKFIIRESCFCVCLLLA